MSTEAPTPVLIETNDALVAFCTSLESADFLTIDTEFHRENTYYPILCLIQVAGPDAAALIDPKAEGIDLAPLWKLLTKTTMPKVLHACRQDMEIVYQLTGGKLITPLFDTQVAAQAVGYGESVSYENLVRDLVGAPLDKGQRFTDWQRRPLSDAQKHYALADVTHLRVVYQKLLQRLETMNRSEWIAEEMSGLLDPAIYVIQPEDAWRRLRVRQQSPQTLAKLQALAAWRETEAQRRNVPRGRIATDDALQELMLHPPKKLEDFSKLRMLRGRLKPEAEKQILEALERAANLPQESWPRLPAKPKYPEGFDEAMDLLKLLLKTRARQLQVPPRLIVDGDELEDLLIHPTRPNLIDHGWRFEVFGREAKALLAGEFGMCYNPKTASLDFVSLNTVA